MSENESAKVPIEATRCDGEHLLRAEMKGVTLSSVLTQGDVGVEMVAQGVCRLVGG